MLVGRRVRGIDGHPPQRLQTTSADFSRYLPRTTSKRAIVGWTALGGFLPNMALCSLGVFAATAVDMTDPQSALEKILPGWFTAVLLLALVLGTIAINALTAYSAGLALQAVGLCIRRSVSVLFDGAAAIALTLYGLLVSNFLDTVSNVLQLTVVLFCRAAGPRAGPRKRRTRQAQRLPQQRAAEAAPALS